MKKTLLIILVAAFGLTAGFLANRLLQQPAAPNTIETSAPGQRPDFKLKDLEGKLHHASEWDGKVVMINFWASWCPPCVREIPAFIKLQKDYADKGLVIVGIALDSKQNIIDFTDPMDINYPVLMAEQEGIALSQAYGNRLGVLPYTVIIDRKGKIVYTHRSELTYTLAEKVIKPLL